MPEPLDFYFDFSSPYGYFAGRQVDELAARHGRACRWRPMLLGPAFKASGNARLIDQPLKGGYSRLDWDRMGRMLGVPYRFPDPFPVATLAAARAFWWIEAGAGEAAAKTFARAVFAAYFEQGRDISDKAVVASLYDGDPDSLLAAVEDPVWKARCKDETEAAIARGVFGSPFLFVDGEPFWGADRLGMVEEWLRRGGW